MKVNKEEVKKAIKYAIGRGVWNEEEIDVTTKAIMEIIEPLIKAVEDETTKGQEDVS